MRCASIALEMQIAVRMRGNGNIGGVSASAESNLSAGGVFVCGSRPGDTFEKPVEPEAA